MDLDRLKTVFSRLAMRKRRRRRMEIDETILATLVLVCYGALSAYLLWEIASIIVGP